MCCHVFVHASANPQVFYGVFQHSTEVTFRKKQNSFHGSVVFNKKRPAKTNRLKLGAKKTPFKPNGPQLPQKWLKPDGVLDRRCHAALTFVVLSTASLSVFVEHEHVSTVWWVHWLFSFQLCVSSPSSPWKHQLQGPRHVFFFFFFSNIDIIAIVFDIYLYKTYIMTCSFFFMALRSYI